MPTCPHCNRKFKSWRAVGGHIGKVHKIKTAKVSARIPLALKKEFDRIREELGITECQAITNLIQTYVSAHRAGILQSPPKKLIPSIITLRVGDGRKARKIARVILEEGREPFSGNISPELFCPSCGSTRLLHEPIRTLHTYDGRWYRCTQCGHYFKRYRF